MIFHSKMKQKLARFLVKRLNRRPVTVAKFLNISRATVYRYIK